MIDLLLSIIKYLILLFLLSIAYYVYTSIISPYLLYRKYKNHPNVKVGDRFNPIVGDSLMFLDDVNNGRVFYHSLRKYSNQIKDKDVVLFYLGMNPYFKMRTPKAIKELEKLIPTKVDREPDKIGFGKLNGKAFGLIKSTKSYLDRKKTYMKLLSLNSSSKYIPNMLSTLKTNFENWKIGEKHN